MGERRFFLVALQAPNTLGLYTIRARVSSVEVDTDSTNNWAETSITNLE